MSFDGGSLVASFIVSGVGFVLFEYGRRMKRMPQLGVGLVMLIYPYFVSNIWVMLGVGLVLVVLLWLGLAQGI